MAHTKIIWTIFYELRTYVMSKTQGRHQERFLGKYPVSCIASNCIGFRTLYFFGNRAWWRSQPVVVQLSPRSILIFSKIYEIFGRKFVRTMSFFNAKAFVKRSFWKGQVREIITWCSLSLLRNKMESAARGFWESQNQSYRNLVQTYSILNDAYRIRICFIRWAVDIGQSKAGFIAYESQLM